MSKQECPYQPGEIRPEVCAVLRVMAWYRHCVWCVQK